MQADAAWKDKRQVFQDAMAAGQMRDVLGHARELLAMGKVADVAFCATAFRKLSDRLIAQGHRPLKTYLVRSVTVEPILPALQVEAVLGGYVLEVEVGGYGSYMDEMLNPLGSLSRSQAELVLVLLDVEQIAGQLPEVCARGGPGIDAEIDAELESSVVRVRQMLASYRARSAARLVLQGCVVPDATSLGMVGDANIGHSLVNAVKALNRRLAELCGSIADCVFFDVDQVAAQYGRERWRDTRMFLAARLPMAPGAFRPFARGLVRTASTLFRAPRKVLCTDLDNTLWGGILGEDGPQGIATGSAFPGNCYLAYQQYLKELSARGILLAVTSKNNEADVEEAFRTRAADLALGLDNFTVRRIGWGDKADALREMAAELSLGLDAFVFVDDNLMECAAIRHQLPEVAVVEAPVDAPWRMVELLSEEWFFDAASVTADDRLRSGEYKAQAQRTALSNSTGSRDEFLQSLGIVCTFVNAADAPLARSVQLLAKTNQFNLTTRRHSATEVMRFASDPECLAVAVRVRDRFGDAGVVGLALARRQDDWCEIDTLLLSCRVIGRGIETALLAYVAEWATGMQITRLVGEYIETKKNVPARDFYADHGFEREESLGAGGAIVYRFDLSRQDIKTPAWLTVEGARTYERTADTVVTS